MSLSALALAASDLDHDGRLDLVVPQNGGLAVLLGNGDGTFHAARCYATPAGTSVYDINAGDLNGDGALDLVAGLFIPNQHGAPSLSILLGNGDGSFKAATNLSLLSGQFASVFVSIADMDADAIPDLVVSSFLPSGGVVCVLRGNGDGSFQPPQLFGGGRGVFGAVIGDFNDDGKPDIGITNLSDNSISILLHQ